MLSFSALYGSSRIILKFMYAIEKWSRSQRKAIACDAVNALALRKGDDVIKSLYTMFEEYKAYAVKEAAHNVLTVEAEKKNMSFDELCDKLVPSLGFDMNGEKIFDYGNRKFTARIGLKNKIEIYDGNDKKLKNMPKVSQKDDIKKAEKAYEEFKNTQKRFKEVLKIQGERMEKFLCKGRKWTKDSWEIFFLGNPLMYDFAGSIVWGLYKDKKLIETFRYCGDGSFSTFTNKDFDLDTIYEENMKIGIMHILETDVEEIEGWKKYFDDYEIIQPIEQLYRRTFKFDEEDSKKNSFIVAHKERINDAYYIVNKYALKRENFEDTVLCNKIPCIIYKYFEDSGYLSEVTFTVEEAEMKIYKYDKAYCKSELKERKEPQGILMQFKDVDKKIISETVYSIEKVLS